MRIWRWHPTLTGGTGRWQNGDGGAGPQMAHGAAQTCPANFLLCVRLHNGPSVRNSAPCNPQHPNGPSVLPRRKASFADARKLPALHKWSLCGPKRHIVSSDSSTVLTQRSPLPSPCPCVPSPQVACLPFAVWMCKNAIDFYVLIPSWNAFIAYHRFSVNPLFPRRITTFVNNSLHSSISVFIVFSCLTTDCSS